MSILGVNVDARIVAAVRAIGGALIVAALAAVEKLFADPAWSGYSWVPVALVVLRIVEGFFDHSDPARPG